MQIDINADKKRILLTIKRRPQFLHRHTDINVRHIYRAAVVHVLKKCLNIKINNRTIYLYQIYEGLQVKMCQLQYIFHCS